MAFARSVSISATATHTTTVTGADDPTKEINKDQWNGTSAHSVSASGTSDVSGAIVGGIPYCPTATTETTSANLTFAEGAGTDTPRITITNSGSSTGSISIGGNGAVSAGNGAIYVQSEQWLFKNQYGTLFVGVGGSGNAVFNTSGTSAHIALTPNSTTKATLYATAGRGLELIAGTATTDVNALSVAQTMNAAAVAFTGWKGTFTEGASGTAAGTKLINLLYGTSGAESTQFAVSKTGLITTGGTDGVASFGPALPTSITVKNGIITAIS